MGGGEKVSGSVSGNNDPHFSSRRSSFHRKRVEGGKNRKREKEKEREDEGESRGWIEVISWREGGKI